MTMTPERLAELDAVMARATAAFPITSRDTADYAEITFGSSQTQAMSMEPATLLAINDMFASIPDLRAHIDAQAATIARVIGAAKSLLALCEQAGLADDLLAAVFPDSKNRSGQTRDETAKQARRTMNEARAAIAEAAGAA